MIDEELIDKLERGVPRVSGMEQEWDDIAEADSIMRQAAARLRALTQPGMGNPTEPSARASAYAIDFPRPASAQSQPDSRADRYLRDAQARQRGENLDGSPRRECVATAPGGKTDDWDFRSKTVIEQVSPGRFEAKAQEETKNVFACLHCGGFGTVHGRHCPRCTGSDTIANLERKAQPTKGGDDTAKSKQQPGTPPGASASVTVGAPDKPDEGLSYGSSAYRWWRSHGHVRTAENSPAQPALLADLAGLASYDAGLLSDYGGGNVEWWQDYMRAELGCAHDFYEAQLSAIIARHGGKS
ncbi:hypothetical protein GJ654_18585 [Rhodoblastus acidophilus]|uniref:Uncharacterized protein n=1 Tax=Rhodoblastus acidophilus TaxID=1074 RepID=A0A6N8DV06_RHOAC|nr:hypothetical protein [Rhodoblastus acidophilus]MCW2276331.1 rubrerythrin [Rhodoblastus acidophilus]MTV32991.1 hypothetical protein [Rhodoblastus acidophilus]